MNLKYSVAFLISVFWGLTGCAEEIRYNMPCQVPDTVVVDDVIGRWKIDYIQYLSADYSKTARVNGREEITLNADGTYTQTFHSEELEYESSILTWELLPDAADGPKLKLYNLKFFAYGLDNREGPFKLSPQMPDQLRYQEWRDETGRTEVITVSYPQDGYLFLYPRSCLWKGVLLQGSSVRDPDHLGVQNPPFVRDE